MKPNIRKAKYVDTCDDYGSCNIAFVGKWMCEWKGLKGFGDTVNEAAIALDNVADWHALPINAFQYYKHKQALEYISQ